MLWDLQEVENTIWVEFAATPDGAALAAMAAIIGGWYRTNVLPNLSSAVQLVECAATDMTTNVGATGTWVAPSGSVGGLVSPSLPNNVAMCVSFRTAGRGRSNRGRNFVPGLAEDGVSANTILAARAALITTAYNSLIGTIADNAGTWVIASRVSEGVPRLIGQTSPVTAALVTDLYVDSQRRRLPGRGR
jgi:hypothetical protein